MPHDDIPNNINQLIKEHIDLYLSDPEKAHFWDARPVGLPGLVTSLLLTTTGRKSGKPRRSPLLYVKDGERYLVIASKGGNVEHPFWYKNLMDNPQCHIQVSTLSTNAIARTLDGTQRQTAWKKITQVHPVYFKYQSRTERQIPVVALTPVAD